MIRIATIGDVSDIKALWDESFDDPLNYVDFFYNHVASPRDTIVFEAAGGIVSMLTLIPTRFRYLDNVVDTVYVYGAATAKDYQDHGIMTRLLEYAEDYARNAGCQLSVLVPGERYLFDYYKKRGYSSDFNCRIVSIRPGMISSSITADNRITIDGLEAKDIFRLRETALAELPHILWDESQLDFILEDSRIYGEHIASYRGAMGESYALFHKDKKNLYIKECFGASDDACTVLIKELILGQNPKHVTLQLPVNSSLFRFEGTLTKFGMAKPLTVNTSMKAMEPYMNLMLD